MRAPRIIRQGDFATGMTPMIDVVFLLVIFFLVSSHLARRQLAGPLELPAFAVPVAESATVRWLVVSIGPERRLRVDGLPLRRSELDQRMAEHLGGAGDQAGLRLRVDRSIPFAEVRPLLRHAAEQGFRQITLAATAR